ncbi:hypothetical protein HYV88_02640 [Candidatus Woesearchaeota archaeon]|nr:hypothetical protein [Candidatus Woesearchaeota archaeon]
MSIDTISDREKVLININRDYVKSEQSFSNKIFFGFISLAIGFLYYFYTNQALHNAITAMTPTVFFGIFFMLSGIYFMIEISTSNANRINYSILAKKIINNYTELKRYDIKPLVFEKQIFYAIIIACIFGGGVWLYSTSFIWTTILTFVVGMTILFMDKFLHYFNH